MSEARSVTSVLENWCKYTPETIHPSLVVRADGHSRSFGAESNTSPEPQHRGGASHQRIFAAPSDPQTRAGRSRLHVHAPFGPARLRRWLGSGQRLVEDAGERCLPACLQQPVDGVREKLHERVLRARFGGGRKELYVRALAVLGVRLHHGDGCSCWCSLTVGLSGGSRGDVADVGQTRGVRLHGRQEGH